MKDSIAAADYEVGRSERPVGKAEPGLELFLVGVLVIGDIQTHALTADDG